MKPTVDRFNPRFFMLDAGYDQLKNYETARNVKALRLVRPPITGWSLRSAAEKTYAVMRYHTGKAEAGRNSTTNGQVWNNVTLISS
ncbi:hypothetical protein [Paenibacillus sp. 19GGS1-52]|uniref:hypothetical protein n=1 Tax=Paenibacillus sp. 19GGS1-52 TaxID=2758563 RepID=UPI001EFBFC4F|nr:hypothetical protein [Paenibacillus sp. 19GGS1-52]